ncbi:D-alanine--D-alanine ligase A [Carnimonas sp. R-84865]
MGRVDFEQRTLTPSDTMKKLRIALIFGGNSTEHEVSLQSAKNIAAALDTSRFEIVPVGITKQGQWLVAERDDSFLQHADDPERIALAPSSKALTLAPACSDGQWRVGDTALAGIDVALPVVHGGNGEDGSLQGLLNILDIPYVGSDVLGSAVCMDKDIAKRLLRDAGIPVAPSVTVTRQSRRRLDSQAIIDELGLPLFVKPASQGSSVGVTKVKQADELAAALDDAFIYDHKVLVEKAIDGREIECAVLGNSDGRELPKASVCGEIVLHDEFYSYATKYISASGAGLSIPAELNADIAEQVRQTAVDAFQVLECQGLARVDFFVTEDGNLMINEVNTLPGFTRISMYPKLWEASGLPYDQLLTRLVELAIERHQDNATIQHNVSLTNE